jgi:hypothetical protein
MASLLNPMILSGALLAGLAATANAQSVSAVPPTGSPPASYSSTLPPQNAHTGISGSTQSFYPKPGGGGLWKEEHYQLPGQSAGGGYPGPKPN